MRLVIEVDACVWCSVRLCLSTSSSWNSHHRCFTWHNQDPLQRQSRVMDAQVWAVWSAVDWYHGQLHGQYVLAIFLHTHTHTHTLSLSLSLSLSVCVCGWVCYVITCTFARNAVGQLIARRVMLAPHNNHSSFIITYVLSSLCRSHNSVLTQFCVCVINLLNVALVFILLARYSRDVSACRCLVLCLDSCRNVSVSSCLGQLLSVLAHLISS